MPRRCEGARLKPYLVLATYKPSRWNAQRVGEDLCALTAERGLIPHLDIAHGPLTKVPWYDILRHAEVRRRSFRTKMAEGWHYDGDTTPGSQPNCAIVLWASNNPTQIQFRYPVLDTGEGYQAYADSIKTWQPKPYEVVIFRNLGCLHRRPADVPRIRWVFRQRVAIPTTMELP